MSQRLVGSCSHRRFAAVVRRLLRPARKHSAQTHRDGLLDCLLCVGWARCAPTAAALLLHSSACEPLFGHTARAAVCALQRARKWAPCAPPASFVPPAFPVLHSSLSLLFFHPRRHTALINFSLTGPFPIPKQSNRKIAGRPTFPPLGELGRGIFLSRNSKPLLCRSFLKFPTPTVFLWR